jgi:GNAT superfamily N-acetyltransferase
MQDINIRLVTKNDFQKFRDSLIPFHDSVLDANDHALLEAMGDFIDEGAPLFGAFYSDRVLGLIRYGVEGFGLGEQVKVKETLIGTIFVHPQYRDLGIGKKLVRYAVSHASTPHVIADPLDEQAHDFFAHCGFEPNYLYDLEDGGDWLMISKKSH